LDGKPGVVEYSDLDSEAMHARNEEGKLLFSHGSIAIHILNRSFIESLDEDLPLHRAGKRTECFVPNAEGGGIEFRELVKFEKFLFDAIPLAENPSFWETIRKEEFAPLKNRTGVDSIESCKAGLVNKYARWLEQCGVVIPRDEDDQPRHLIEISPLYAADERALKNRLGDTVNSINEDTLLV
jgi:UDP-N-acetylglucosamine/UDP-N-acetylgalactosamine diphosphorylase